ncbi:uncharacterized protein LOC114358153 isoform X2 [Ostrinia furnacalis]|uniref:uncharacterized protein LOC114358153 isoform X1 n=1 Tax=Ostrinia furnacalis TaxID=93504 RepID=UPI00103F4828|nr:uncharacterized protein LOC114358153 isoform X1 [Ostrinia furnacalis]XP_028167846.1 uncharacterized protein LOC114358153 isoform X2 [Ostrinia furnacalis]
MAERGYWCAGCRGRIDDGGAFMQCVKCKKIYDILCANFTETMFLTLSPEFKNTWICVECRSKIPKTDNSHTPIRHYNLHDMSISSDCPDISMSSPDRVTVRAGARYAQVTKQNDPDPVKNILDCMQATLLKELKKAQDEFEARLTEKISTVLTEQFSVLKSELLDKISDLTMKVTDLEKKIEDMGTSSTRPEKTKVPKVSRAINIIPGSTNPSLKQIINKPKPSDKQEGRRNTGATNGTPTRNLSATQNTQTPISGKKDEEADDGGWIQVRRKRAHTSLPGVLRGTAVPGATSLCAAERWRYLHLYYVQEGTTVEQVRTHLKSICDSDICTVEALKPRGRYASFKLGVPAKYAENVMSSNNWAEDICVKPWRQSFRVKESKKSES